MNHQNSISSTTTNTTATTHHPHLYSTSCTYCSYSTFHDDLIQPTMYTSGSIDDDFPFQFNYLLSLFTAPDMVKHLTQASISEDIYALPIHLQRLISEAKEEVVLERRTKTNEQNQQQRSLALIRLERVRNYVWMQSGGDIANLMMTLTELMGDEDELENVLGI
ncbi:hypothetical protein INT45_001047 [Circinella minor]|uniref:Uncharacterized protein n=1 Tax=Circinella minor TaxID=1195481 RepID=A0A8H7VN25_9FUNG|nr:hypothetical protein INT45_001047 [Circinella minor]